MYREYLEKLKQSLKAVQVCDREGAFCEDYEEAMQKLTELFLEARREEKRVFFIGNGGSAAVAVHMTADFMKNGRMKTCSMYDSSVMTCLGNDYGYEHIFSYQLERLAEEGDLLVAISSSGNSQNIVNAVHTAQNKGLKIVTFSGFEKENYISSEGNYNVHVPIQHYGIVESIHNLILQQIADILMER